MLVKLNKQNILYYFTIEDRLRNILNAAQDDEIKIYILKCLETSF